MRLSDFLLWQSSHSVLAFEKVLWPEFSFWNLLSAVFYYQRHHKVALSARSAYLKQTEQEEIDALKLFHLASGDVSFETVCQESKKRTDNFLSRLESNRREKLIALSEQVGA